MRAAIKFFARGSSLHWQLLQDEVKQLANLDGVTGIVWLKDVVPDADPPYFVMQYAEGGSLAERLRRGPVPVSEAVRLMTQVAEALAALHTKGIIHCDLKPGNILLDGAANPLIADFGQAQLSGSLSPSLGTFFYMAPEQADTVRQMPDTRWDVHGLGAILYALVTGKPPRHDTTLSRELADTAELDHRLRKYREGVLRAKVPQDHHRVAGMDPLLARIIDRCLEADPARRYRDAGAVQADLRARARWQRQRPLLVAAGLATALVMGVLVLAGYHSTDSAIQQSRKNLLDQDRTHNHVAARLMADSLRAELHTRVEKLEELARDQQLREMVSEASARIQPGAKRPPWQWDGPEAGRCRAQLDEVYRRRGVHDLFPGSLIVTVVGPGKGFQLAHVSPHPDDWAAYRGSGGGTDRYSYQGRLLHWGELESDRARMEQDWSWRDWFSSGGNKSREAGYPPIRRPHISQPYVGQRDGKLMFMFTVPIWPPKSAQHSEPVRG